MAFLPTTRQELNDRGWDQCDIIFVSGDTYIDSPTSGIALLGQYLTHEGYRVGIIAQPSLNDEQDILRLGSPRLFWGVTAGSVDSMVANYTALRKKRRSDDLTPGGRNTRRPDRATIVYCNLIRCVCRPTPPIVIGGIEASLRRIAHYDYWDDRLRRSLLFDAKADYLVYGMAEKSVAELAHNLALGGDPKTIRGLCYAASEPRPDYLQLPSFETVTADPRAFIRMFHTFYQQNNPCSGQGLCQAHGSRYLIHNPPQPYETAAELDRLYELPFEHDAHPYYRQQGVIRALDTVRFSITTHRGCCGECHFCAISIHQGRAVRNRSCTSIVREARLFTAHPLFKGIISDVGGPTANLYGVRCASLTRGGCRQQHCLTPSTCQRLYGVHQPQIELLRRLRSIPGIRHVFVASGIRYDLVVSDKVAGQAYLEELIRWHLSGQLKIAPEHSDSTLLKLMGKPEISELPEFIRRFREISRHQSPRRFLTYYFIAAHPGCTEKTMQHLQRFIARHLRITPEQVQLFTPTPSTYSTLMYYTELNPFSLEPLFVEKNLTGKMRQKAMIAPPAATRSRFSP